MKQNEQTNPKSENVSRRDFLKMGMSAVSAVALLELGGVGLMFMRPRKVEGAFGGRVNAGPVSSFPEGSVVEFPNGRFFLIRTQDGGFLAFYQRCTHLGCSVTWQAGENQFFCPCHASSFDLNGDVQNPPAPRALDLFAVSIEDEKVIVDTGQKLSRDAFSPDQLVFA